MNLDEIEFPFEGEALLAPEKKFQETVLLVPFFGARKVSLKKHALFLNHLGFDIVLFDMIPVRMDFSMPMVSFTGKIGMKHVWADQIEKLLNLIPGKKIVFSFSNPSGSAVEALARRKAYDVTAFICDGGPSGNLFQSMVNYYTFEEPVSFPPKKIAKAALMALLWTPHPQSIHNDLNSFPKDFPVMSVQGWKDKLIPPSHIDLVFSPHAQLDFEKLSLPQAGHLNGLRDFKDIYEARVSHFIKRFASGI